jgi:hypothetical protein
MHLLSFPGGDRPHFTVCSAALQRVMSYKPYGDDRG